MSQRWEHSPHPIVTNKWWCDIHRRGLGVVPVVHARVDSLVLDSCRCCCWILLNRSINVSLSLALGETIYIDRESNNWINIGIVIFVEREREREIERNQSNCAFPENDQPFFLQCYWYN
jgi:hypothetical protein